MMAICPNYPVDVAMLVSAMGLIVEAVSIFEHGQALMPSFCRFPLTSVILA